MKINLENIENSIKESINYQKKKIDKEGFSVSELEADVTIPAEYIILMHFLGDIDIKLQNKIKNYILNEQNEEGGWSLYHKGKSNLSATVKAYFALKLSGESSKNKNLLKAKKLILGMGGAENSNVFTRITLALFEQISWKTIPVMPIEIMRLPNWFLFHLDKISYWSRTVLVPLLIVMEKKPLANNPNSTQIDELFNDKNVDLYDLQKNKNFWSSFFLILDSAIRKFRYLFPKENKKKSIREAYSWVLRRLNGKDGLGGIFPAMVNALIALKIDEENDHYKEIKIAKNAIDNLLIIKDKSAYCQPCLSPIWDTGWVGQALIENDEDIKQIIQWLLKKEIKVTGDWAVRRPNVQPGGWAFQFNNDFYPDVDDTALIGMLLDRYNKKSPSKKVTESINRTRKWIIGMQSKNGGWGAFDADNSFEYLNYIPFADHGALLDPPSVDVTARCLSFLGQISNEKDSTVIEKAITYIINEQEKDGSWFGRWGTNYIYGTWSVLSAINLINFDKKVFITSKAVDYLKKSQRKDGGWGEDGSTYENKNLKIVKDSTPSQTAWAILGLISAGEIKSKEVELGINYLSNNFSHGRWKEKLYTAVGFPKVFYLKYHGYSEYFPLLAISRYKNLIQSNYLKTSSGV